MTASKKSALVFRVPGLPNVLSTAVEHFEKRPPEILPLTDEFLGTGVYAIYYEGKKSLYSKYLKNPIAGSDVVPIYVGKAVPQGWRTSRSTTLETKQLFNRLGEHASSISQCKDLSLEDFRVRYMVLGLEETGLIAPVEAHLIQHYRPIWNTGIDGFGNHDPGSGRSRQSWSMWDTLHQGRGWVLKLESKPMTEEKVVKNFRKWENNQQPVQLELLKNDK